MDLALKNNNSILKDSTFKTQREVELKLYHVKVNVRLMWVIGAQVARNKSSLSGKQKQNGTLAGAHERSNRRKTAQDRLN